MCFFIKYSIFRRGIPLRWENLCGSFFIFLCRPSCLYSLCVYIQTEIWHSTNSLNLQFAPPDNVVLQDDNWCQTLVLITGKHFCDIKSNSYDINNMKFDSNVSIKIIFKTLGSYFSSKKALTCTWTEIKSLTHELYYSIHLLRFSLKFKPNFRSTYLYSWKNQSISVVEMSELQISNLNFFELVTSRKNCSILNLDSHLR